MRAAPVVANFRLVGGQERINSILLFLFFFKDMAWRLLLPTLSLTSHWPELSHKAKGILSGHLGNVVCIREAMSSAKA